jgi:microcin C transport system ATP-binding protein
LTLRAGQTLGVVGESGSGKTTLGLALTRLIASQGRIAFVGKDIGAYSFSEMKPLQQPDAGGLSGSPMVRCPRACRSPKSWLKGLAIHEPQLNADERDARVAEALAEVGLDPKPDGATRTSFPAASASVSRSPAPWC